MELESQQLLVLYVLAWLEKRAPCHEPVKYATFLIILSVVLASVCFYLNEII